jgi:hypothetical protein
MSNLTVNVPDLINLAKAFDYYLTPAADSVRRGRYYVHTQIWLGTHPGFSFFGDNH